MSPREEVIKAWVVTPEGRFLQVIPREEPCTCEDCQDEDEEVLILDEEDPDSICPMCDKRIVEGDVTVPLIMWGKLYENRRGDYPICGHTRFVHVWCVGNPKEEEGDEET